MDTNDVAMIVTAGTDRLAGSERWAWLDWAERGFAGRVRLVSDRRGAAWQAGRGNARRGWYMVRLGIAGMDSNGDAGLGWLGSVLARQVWFSKNKKQ